jgi:type IV pilus assembly protein PilC
VSSTSGSIVISDALDEVRDSVRSGKPVAATLENHSIFTPLSIQMISTGEETGGMPEMLDKVADFYEQEVDTASDALASILEPIMIVILASIVGGMVVSLYLPIFKVFDLIK